MKLQSNAQSNCRPISHVFCFLLLLCSGVNSHAQDTAFASLKSSFQERVKTSFDIDPTSITEDVAVYVTKPLTAKLISETITRGGATVSYKMANEQSFVPEPLDITTEDKPDAHMECSRDQFCNYGCDQQWPWEKLGCEIAKETCKDTQKLDCERRKTMAQLVSAKKIATVSFKEVTIKGRASATNVTAQLTPNLDNFSLTAALSAQMELSCSGYMTPELLIQAFGCLKHEFKFTDEPIEVKESGFQLKSRINLVAESNGIALRVEPEKPTVTLHFAGTPVLRFIAKNPLSFLACPVPYGIAGIADLVAPKDMAKKEIELSVPSTGPKIGTITEVTSGLSLTLTPKVTSKAIGMVGSISSK